MKLHRQHSQEYHQIFLLWFAVFACQMTRTALQKSWKTYSPIIKICKLLEIVTKTETSVSAPQVNHQNKKRIWTSCIFLWYQQIQCCIKFPLPLPRNAQIYHLQIPKLQTIGGGYTPPVGDYVLYPHMLDCLLACSYLYVSDTLRYFLNEERLSSAFLSCTWLVFSKL